ncbi:expressed unknown protein [Seminavis robusta]|uniref:Uncharacterized protein n=1 Tax=Seminavis robusta TaxID=568900 RepID=A0A9N8D6X2_9STRA|nr:expressed unknown protein [Seminavis robusta]|eukprot:Sro22_g015410.1 n/a (110) ;mRNA; r:116353-116682
MQQTAEEEAAKEGGRKQQTLSLKHDSCLAYPTFDRRTNNRSDQEEEEEEDITEETPAFTRADLLSYLSCACHRWKTAWNEQGLEDFFSSNAWQLYDNAQPRPSVYRSSY